MHRLGAAFLQAPKISIDYAVMEKTDRAAVVPLDAEWSDLGAWDAVHAASPQDLDGNAAPADAVLHDTRGTLVRSATGQTVGHRRAEQRGGDRRGRRDPGGRPLQPPRASSRWSTP